jgi:Holliday junction resolvasome RuvABC endonuclease subunit
MTTLLSIDPSLYSLGWALYSATQGAGRYDDIVGGAWRYGCIHPKGTTRVEKWSDVLFRLVAQMGDWAISHLVAEWPAYFASTRGKIAAQSGHTLELAGMIGYIAGRLSMRPERIALYTPQQWKGSVPKSATRAKFIRTFGDSSRLIANCHTDDVIDAIMIAVHHLSRR